MPFLSLEQQKEAEKIGGVCLISGTIFILVRFLSDLSVKEKKLRFGHVNYIIWSERLPRFC